MKEFGSTKYLPRALSDARIASEAIGGCFCVHDLGPADSEHRLYEWHKTSSRRCVGRLETVFVDGRESGVVTSVGVMPARRIPGRSSTCQN